MLVQFKDKKTVLLLLKKFVYYSLRNIIFITFVAAVSIIFCLFLSVTNEKLMIVLNEFQINK